MELGLSLYTTLTNHCQTLVRTQHSGDWARHFPHLPDLEANGSLLDLLGDSVALSTPVDRPTVLTVSRDESRRELVITAFY